MNLPGVEVCEVCPHGGGMFPEMRTQYSLLRDQNQFSESFPCCLCNCFLISEPMICGIHGMGSDGVPVRDPVMSHPSVSPCGEVVSKEDVRKNSKYALVCLSAYTYKCVCDNSKI